MRARRALGKVPVPRASRTGLDNLPMRPTSDREAYALQGSSRVLNRAPQIDGVAAPDAREQILAVAALSVSRLEFDEQVAPAEAVEPIGDVVTNAIESQDGRPVYLHPRVDLARRLVRLPVAGLALARVEHHSPI
jgi:hypothetical protein